MTDLTIRKNYTHAFYARIIGMMEYYGINFQIKKSSRSTSLYIVLPNKKTLRLSDHDAPGGSPISDYELIYGKYYKSDLVRFRYSVLKKTSPHRKHGRGISYEKTGYR